MTNNTKNMFTGIICVVTGMMYMIIFNKDSQYYYLMAEYYDIMRYSCALLVFMGTIVSVTSFWTYSKESQRKAAEDLFCERHKDEKIGDYLRK